MDITDLKIVSQLNRANCGKSLQVKGKLALTLRELYIVPAEYYWRGLILAVGCNVRKNDIVISFFKTWRSCDT